MKKTARRSFLLSSAVGAVGVAGLAQVSAAPAPDGPPTRSQPTYRFTREIPAEDGFDLVGGLMREIVTIMHQRGFLGLRPGRLHRGRFGYRI